MFIDKEKDGDDFNTPSVEDTLNDLNNDEGTSGEEDNDTDTSEEEGEDFSDESEDEESEDEEEESSDDDDEEDEDTDTSEDDDDTDDDSEESEESDDDDSEEDNDEGAATGEEDTGKKSKKKSKDGDSVPISKFIKRGNKIKDLKRQIIQLQTTGDTSSDTGKKNLDDAFNKLAEETGADPKFIKGFAEIILKNAGVPKSLAQGLKFLTEGAEAENQRQQASGAWKKEILPLAKQEYPNATPAQLRKLEEKFIDVALDPEHFGVKDLKVLYKGIDTFRGFTGSKKKKSGERTGGKTGRTITNKTGKKDLSDSEAPKKWNLSPEEHDKWTQNMIENQGDSGTKVIRRKDNVV